VQNLQKIFGRFESLNGQATRKGSRIVNDSRRLRSTGREEGEIWRGGDAHHGAQTMFAKLSDLLIGQLLPAGFLSDMAKISHARAVAAKFRIRRKRQCCLNEDLVKTLFLGGRTRPDYEVSLSRHCLGGSHPCSDPLGRCFLANLRYNSL
jgi:hypothetical protein